jgi:hypothetical protein
MLHRRGNEEVSHLQAALQSSYEQLQTCKADANSAFAKGNAEAYQTIQGLQTHIQRLQYEVRDY